MSFSPCLARTIFIEVAAVVAKDSYITLMRRCISCVLGSILSLTQYSVYGGYLLNKRPRWAKGDIWVGALYP